MTSPTQNRFQNRFPHHSGTRWGTTDQTQSQTQTVVKAVCGVCGSGFHPSNGECLAAVAAKADEKQRLAGVKF